MNNAQLSLLSLKGGWFVCHSHLETEGRKRQKAVNEQGGEEAKTWQTQVSGLHDGIIVKWFFFFPNAFANIWIVFGAVAGPYG